jgi:ribonuclease Z
MFAVTILGNNSAIPAYNRHPTAQVVTIEDSQILIDCGEGTQMQLSKYKVRRSKINYILISHLHGDHYFGLIGLLTSMALMGRTQDLFLYAPPELKKIIDLQLEVANTQLPYTIHFVALTHAGLLTENKKFSISCFEVDHRIPCWGFIIKENKQQRKLNADAVKQYEIPAAFYKNLKNGEDYITKNNERIKNEWVTIAAPAAKIYAYCADTIYKPDIVPYIEGADLLYHETTYLKEFTDKAAFRHHSTTEQAALIAKQANAKKLLIGHFSSRYEDVTPFEKETKEVFVATQLALEGTTYLV